VANLAVDFAGIRAPNPFWLASAPPTNSGDQVMRAFDEGWGGAVWKTLADPIINVSRRLAGVDHGPRRLAGLSNIELTTDRSLEDNLREIAETKKRYSGHAVVVSLMGAYEKPPWLDLARRAEDSGCDALELNFGCPHGMPERGMGAFIGQVPEYAREITGWVKQATSLPVLVKLTPNVTDVGVVAKAAQEGGADAIALINTVASIAGVDLDTFTPVPSVAGRSARTSGYCGPAVKPIALHKVASVAQACPGLPISGIGGIESWRDAAEFFLLGASTVQICTAVMHYGFRIIGDLCNGLSDYLDDKGLPDLAALSGKALPRLGAWEDLDLNFQVRAQIDQQTCIGCGLCHVACRDGAHQAIDADRENGVAVYRVDHQRCVGCALCSLICPVQDCITMVEQEPRKPPRTWKQMTEDGQAGA
jgi:dihydropyrimidine dehydrogenase (NAD+) subunit PreA